MGIEEIRSVFKKYSPEEELGSVLDAGNSFIVFLTRPNLPKGVFVDDNQYIMDKKSKKILPFRVTDNRDLYKRALKNVVYMKPGLRDD